MPMLNDESSSTKPCKACGAGIESLTKECPNCGFNPNKGRLSDLEKKRAQEVVKLIEKPVRLSEFKRKYPFLNQGEFDTDYVRIIDHAMQSTKSKQIRHTLTSFPREWAIQKVGLFRRFLTLFIDWPILLGIFLGGLAVLIGSATEPGILPLNNGGKAAIAWVWFFISYFLYFVGSEHILGATIGGFFVGIRVVNKFGNRQSFSILLFRNLYKLIPFVGPYALAPYVKPDHEIVKS